MLFGYVGVARITKQHCLDSHDQVLHLLLPHFGEVCLCLSPLLPPLKWDVAHF
jgi:hypothetical protein